MSDSFTIVYTFTDEAPAIAMALFYCFLAIVEALTSVASMSDSLSDISLAGRILGNAPDDLLNAQKSPMR